MISESTLTELLHAAGDSVPVPADGAEQVRDALGPQVAQRRWIHRPSNPRLLSAAAGVVVLALVGVGIAAGVSSGGGHHGQTSAAVALAPEHAGSAAGSGKSDQQLAAAPTAGAAEAPAAPGVVNGPAAGSGSGTDAVPTTTPRVVRKATISLQAGDGKVPASLDGLRGLAEQHGGYVASSQGSLTSDDPTGTVVLRVPVAQYAQVRDAITSGRYGKALDVSESGADVTNQYVDLDARIHALQASRQTYLTMLSKADTIGDTLAVQQRLDQIQQQLEQLQGQQKVLADQSDKATLTVSVGEKPAAVLTPSAGRTGFDKAFHDAGHRFTHGLQRTVAATGTALLVLLAIAVVALVCWVAVRSARRRMV